MVTFRQLAESYEDVANAHKKHGGKSIIKPKGMKVGDIVAHTWKENWKEATSSELTLSIYGNDDKFYSIYLTGGGKPAGQDEMTMKNKDYATIVKLKDIDSRSSKRAAEVLDILKQTGKI